MGPHFKFGHLRRAIGRRSLKVQGTDCSPDARQGLRNRPEMPKGAKKLRRPLNSRFLNAEIGLYILERRSIICVSDNHIDRARQQLIPKGSFAAPTIIGPGDYETDGLTVMTPAERTAYEAVRITGQRVRKEVAAKEQELDDLRAKMKRQAENFEAFNP